MARPAQAGSQLSRQKQSFSFGEGRSGERREKFIEPYAGRKAHPIPLVRAKMLTDCTSIVDKTPVWRAGRRGRAELIVHRISDTV